MGSLSAGSQAGVSNGGLDLKKRGRNSRALSAYNGNSKRSRVGTSLPQTSSLPTSPSGSLSGFDSRLLVNVSSITAPDLLWIRDRSSEPIVYPASADGPFIILMESTVPGRNLGKYGLLTIADQIDKVIQGERTIHRNWLNQMKIVCSGSADANLLICSHELKMAGYKAFLPILMIRKKATIRDVDSRHSPTTILNRLDPRSRDIVTAIRRRTNKEGAPSEIIEFTMGTTSIPSFVSLADFELELFPVTPPPRRCYICQRFRHISSQSSPSRPGCSSARVSTTTLGIALMGFSLLDVKTASAITWPPSVSVRCFYMNILIRALDTGAIAVFPRWRCLEAVARGGS